MRIYSDTATRQLQEYASQQGDHCQIRKIEAQDDGRYFVVSVDDEPLKCPVSLGFTDYQARDAIRRGTWKHLALRSGAQTLNSSSSSRYSKRRRYPW